jgi:hypothetical protein
MALDHLVAAVLDDTGGPVELDSMVNIAARVMGVVDLPADFEKVAQSASNPSPASAPAESGQSWQAWTEQVWAEILQLPVRQRVALLLDLRVDGEGSPLVLFTESGVASLHAIAAALEMPAAELAALWHRLPLPDLEIAGRLALTRQQVINLRTSARRRLARRMTGAVQAIQEQS